MVAKQPPESSLIGRSSAWEQLIGRVWEGRLRLKRRVAFTPPERWDRDRLQAFQQLPAGHLLKRISAADTERFGQLAASLVGRDSQTGQASVWDGIGFGVEYAGQFISGCTAFPILRFVQLCVSQNYLL